MSRTRKLDAVEIRVLGALLEKQQTTPDAYPLSTKQVLAACNQKTNRDPVMELTETEVTEALDRLREDVLVWRGQSARAERWEQRLDRRWDLDGAKKAIMTLLLLRGPQTPGELRTRSERMHAFDSVEEVETTLQELSEGFDALVTELPRQPGQRETRWMHLESADGDPRETHAAVPESPAVPDHPAPARPAPGAASGPRPAATAETKDAAEAEDAVDPAQLARLEATVRSLEDAVSTLQQQLQKLRTDLGAE